MIWRNWNLGTLLMGIQNGKAVLENSLADHQKVKHRDTIWPNNPTPKISLDLNEKKKWHKHAVSINIVDLSVSQVFSTKTTKIDSEKQYLKRVKIILLCHLYMICLLNINIKGTLDALRVGLYPCIWIGRKSCKFLFLLLNQVAMVVLRCWVYIYTQWGWQHLSWSRYINYYTLMYSLRGFLPL